MLISTKHKLRLMWLLVLQVFGRKRIEKQRKHIFWPEALDEKSGESPESLGFILCCMEFLFHEFNKLIIMILTIVSKVIISLPGWSRRHLFSLWCIFTHLLFQTCEKQRLKQISKSDESTLSFLFYMTGDRTKQLKFESALYSGWFIHIVNTDSVEMGCLDGGKEDDSFLFIIQKWWRVTSFRRVVLSQISFTFKILLLTLSGSWRWY